MLRLYPVLAIHFAMSIIDEINAAHEMFCCALHNGHPLQSVVLKDELTC